VEWDEQDDLIVVRKAGRYSSEDVHRALFPTAPSPRTVAEMKEGIRQHIKRRRASR
jgi:hypothetical protein